MIDQLIERLQQVGLDLTYEEIAETLWLAERIGGFEGQSSEQKPQKSASNVRFEDVEPAGDSTGVDPSSVPLYATDALEPSADEDNDRETVDLPFQVPAATALPNAIDLGRALRPLMRKVPSQTRFVLDEEATVEQFAIQRIRCPVVQPELERWLEVELVVEASDTSFIWRKTVEEFQKKVLERLGAFRNLRTWRLQADSQGQIQLWPYLNLGHVQNWSFSDGESYRFQLGRGLAELRVGDRVSGAQAIKPRSPRELMHPSGRRLILLVSDCRSLLWRQRPDRSTSSQRPTLYDWLQQWASQGPTTVVQVLPESLWEQTELGYGDLVQLSALLPGVANTQLLSDELAGWVSDDGMPHQPVPLSLPVVTLEAKPMRQWAKVVAGVGNTRTPGFWFDVGLLHQYPSEPIKLGRSASAEAKVNRFFVAASEPAQALARLMAAAPVSLSVVHLIQDSLLPGATAVHVAEVFMSDLLYPTGQTNSDGEPIYNFDKGVREYIVKLSDRNLTMLVFTKLTEKIAEEMGVQLDSFDALLSPKEEWLTASGMVEPFAAVANQVLMAMGGPYATLAETVAQQQRIKQQRAPLPDSSATLDLQTLEFMTAQIVDPAVPDGASATPGVELRQEEVVVAEISLERVAPDADGLQVFEFRTGQLEKRGNLLTRLLPGRRSAEWVVTRQRQQGRQRVELLGEGVPLEMVAIPGGTFRMGSPRGEVDRSSSEGPQHQVTVPSFLMGKYPVTQAQWRAVAAMPQIEIELALDPSRLKGVDRPVECVSWHEAMEFCARLSAHTGGQYGLPSEAQWEYACRAGTTTPFHFGETITTELANYDGSSTYNDGPKGEYREETTPVGQFEVANSFGLYDMHGNVWEWCADHWHGNYEGAPTYGSAWLSDDKEASRVLKGGSWIDFPRDCRSASRGYDLPGVRFNDIGFRVSRLPPGSLL